MSEETPEQFRAGVLARLESRRASSGALKILLVSSADPAGKAQVDGMRRALRMLGHQVFGVSATRHPGLVVKNEDAGGQGKVLSLPGVGRIVETFRPDVVLVANNPFPFDVASRAWAAEAGILLLLLDTHPGSLVTSRTLSSYDCYAADKPGRLPGLVNVPFRLGGDASLAMSLSLAKRPETVSFGLLDGPRLKAEYPGLFATLSGDPAIRGAGAGPAEPTAIERALVHVHPPAIGSRRQAAWQCIQSILSGAAVVVPSTLNLPRHLAELPSVFEYDDEAQLRRLMDQLKGESGSLQRSAQAGALALRRTSLLEDQFHDLFAGIEAAASSLPLPVQQRIAGRRAVAAPARGQVVAVSGWYGERNLGDELILDTLLQGLERVNPHGQVVVAAPRPATVERDHSVAAVPRHEVKAAAQLANYADCLIVGGGGIWNDKSVARNGGLAGLFQDPKHSVVNLATLPVLFHALGKPVAGIGLGVGPLREESGRSLVRLMASFSAVLSVRDSHSRELLEGVGSSGAKATVDGDLAFAWSKPLRAPRVSGAGGQDRPLVAVNVRIPDDVDPLAEPHSWPGLAAALTALSVKFNCRFVGIPFQAEDSGELERLFSGLDGASCDVLPFTTDAAQVAADLGACDLVVAMRLHASILSHRMGVISVGLNYEDKIGDYFREVGEEQRLIAREDSEEQLTAVLTAAFEGRGHALGRLVPLVAELELHVREKLDENLRALLAAGKTSPVGFWSL
ncbi:MAG: hypothetical protein JWQ75_223 [Pseudarthrobacter sp.]|nr:hypothetical protein [Pseudarthrobacter sp.]